MTGLHDGSPIPGPGWLDDDTPCVCSRSWVRPANQYWANQHWDNLITDAVLRADSDVAIYVFDAKT